MHNTRKTTRLGKHERACQSNAPLLSAVFLFDDPSLVSQGANGINLSFMVQDGDAPAVVRALHRDFFASVDPEVFALDERLITA